VPNTKNKPSNSKSTNSDVASKEKKRDFGFWFSVISLALSIITFGLTRYEVWDQKQEKTQRAEYLSYRLGVYIGIYLAESQFEGDSETQQATVLAAIESLKNAPSLSNELELGVEIPSSPDAQQSTALYLNLQARIADYHGTRAETAYILGTDIGQFIGSLTPQVSSIHFRGASDSSIMNISPNDSEFFSSRINEYLHTLGFTIQFYPDYTSALYTHTQLLDIDQALVDAWDPVKGRWDKSIKYP